MITYRKAVIEDSDTLAIIRMDNLSKYKKTESDEEWEALHNSVKHYFKSGIGNGTLITWLACDGDEIVATSGLTFFMVTPSMTNITGKQGYITNMYTCPAYRRRGIGQKLLEQTVEDAIMQGCGRLVLYKTGIAERMYGSFGFEDASGYMKYCPSDEL